jgi:hypothetical protein
MKNTDHCLLCENQKVDFTTGVYCNITGKKPKFLEKCSENSFQKTMQEKLFETNYRLEIVKDKKASTMLHLFTFIGFSITVLIGDSFFINYLWNITYNSGAYISSYYIVAVPIIITAIGLGLIPFAVAPLNNYKRTLNIAKENKKKIDDVLNVYEINYNIDVKLFKDTHDSIDIEAILNLVRHGKTETVKLKKINVGTTND